MSGRRAGRTRRIQRGSHEFAHQLDAEEGITSGASLLVGRSGSYNGEDILQHECARLREDDELGRPTVLDPYGAENPAELFAVATESFFETPHPLRKRHPELYAELVRYYRQDPAEWPAVARDDSSAH
jgi:Mlc titration factor MtfA (ptsG expression regulator)